MSIKRDVGIAAASAAAGALATALVQWGIEELKEYRKRRKERADAARQKEETTS